MNASRSHKPLRLALCGLLIAAGCHSTSNRVAQTPVPMPPTTPPRDGSAAPATLTASAGIMPESGAAQTSFQTKFSPEEEVRIHLDMGRALETKGAFEAAVNEYEKAIEVINGPGHRRRSAKITDATKALAHRRMGGALDRLGRFPQAEVHYREALTLLPDDPKVWNDAGYSRYLQGRWQEAESALKTAARLAPEDTKIQTNLGLCLAATGKTDEALAALTKAGGPAVAHANLGYILAASGQPEEARAHYHAALKLQPTLQPVRLALAQLNAPSPSRAPAQVAGTTPKTAANDRNVTRTSTPPKP